MTTPRHSSAVHEVRVRRPAQQIEATLSGGIVPGQAGPLTVAGPPEHVTIVGELQGRRFRGTWSIDGRVGPATVTVVEANRPRGAGGASLVSVCLHGRWSQQGLLHSRVVQATEDLRAWLNGGEVVPAASTQGLTVPRMASRLVVVARA